MVKTEDVDPCVFEPVTVPVTWIQLYHPARRVRMDSLLHACGYSSMFALASVAKTEAVDPCVFEPDSTVTRHNMTQRILKARTSSHVK